MKTSRLIILIVVCVAVVLIVWRSVVYKPEAKPAKKDTKVVDANKVSEPNKPAEPNKPEPGEPNKPEEPEEPNKPSGPNEPNEPNEPSEPMESINFKDMEMKNIIQKLAEWEGKVIIPHPDVMGQKISIYSEKQVPRSRALALIYSTLQAKGFVAEYTDDEIWLKPLSEAKYIQVPLVGPDVPLAAIENKEQIVRKFFKLENYSPTSMSEIVGAMLGEYAYVSADEVTGKLLIIDTVKNLIQLERIIMQFDVPEAEKTVTTIFDIRHGDPGEIVQVLRLLLGAEAGSGSSRPSSRDRDRRRNRNGRERSSGSSGSATSVVIGPTGGPVVLIPEPRRKWIIARASPEDTRQIEKWIDQLDKTEEVTPEYESVQIKYAEDVEEVARRLNEVLKDMPGQPVQMSILIQALPQARQLIIYGRKDIREIAKNLILQIDIPSEQFETKVFKLEHADADQIAQQIEDLYAEEEVPWWYRWRQERTSNWVKAIPLATYQQVTVIASSENMAKIEKQVAEWDVPIDVGKVKPMIITLTNTDPVKMAQLLSDLFSEETEDDMGWFRRWYWGGDEEEKKKIVGPLYGQLTFKPVPDTRKIIVISKMPEAYRVIQELIYDLDKTEMTEVPRVVKIEYADPEDLSERLNAIFSEPGAQVKIRLTEKSLSKTGMASTSEEGENGGEDTGETGTAREYIPPWVGMSRRPEEMPISRVIGRIRFIPDPRSKAILVLAPREFMPDIVETIKELDLPGMQVRVRAVVIEINHSDVTSLGLQLADGGALSGLDNAITVDAVSTLTEAYRHGTVTLDMGVDVTALIDFLVKTTDAKILNQQSLWMKDNEQAVLFKGETVPFTGGITTTGTGVSDQSITYEEVGVTLRVRPNITPQRNVDMKMDLTLSQRTGELVGGQPVRSSMIANTTAIAQDGQTIVLGGILFQQDSVTKRKIPLVGDLPLVGGLFGHEATTQTNNEMIVFITPEVIDEEDMPAETERAEEKMANMLGQFKNAEPADEIE